MPICEECYFGLHDYRPSVCPFVRWLFEKVMELNFVRVAEGLFSGE